MQDKLTLKKYPNRRLYDTENSTYVTLNDVADIVKQGREVEVIDIRTGQDVTAFILTQILMENAKQNNFLLPVSLLHLIIRFGENVLGDFFDTYLEQSIRSYLSYKKSMEEQFKICLELGIDFSEIAQKTFEQIPNFSRLFKPPYEKKMKPEKTATPDAATAPSDVSHDE